jgi:hypothetical protein
LDNPARRNTPGNDGRCDSTLKASHKARLLNAFT